MSVCTATCLNLLYSLCRCPLTGFRTMDSAGGRLLLYQLHRQLTDCGGHRFSNSCHDCHFNCCWLHCTQQHCRAQVSLCWNPARYFEFVLFNCLATFLPTGWRSRSSPDKCWFAAWALAIHDPGTAYPVQSPSPPPPAPLFLQLTCQNRRWALFGNVTSVIHGRRLGTGN